MINTEELIELTEAEEENKNFKLATVVDLFENDTAKIKFDGEDIASEKQYAYLSSYVPKEDDRVLLGAMGGTYIILGKVNYDESPNTEEEIDRYLFDLKKVIMQKGLNVALGIETDTLTVNNGASVVGNIGINGSITATGISATGQVSGNNFNLAGEVKHTGSKVGFFGKSPATKTNVYTLPTSNPTISGAYNAINFIVEVLQSYGLF